MSELVLRNRQRVRRVNLRFLREISKAALTEFLHAENYELGVHLIAAPEMARINQQFLQHSGSTDVITFDHSKPGTRNSELGTCLHGEIFICLDDALTQARQFHTTWQSEIVRYLVHGLWHLVGHDDTMPAARRKMKREENRLLRQLAKRFAFGKLAA